MRLQGLRTFLALELLAHRALDPPIRRRSQTIKRLLAPPQHGGRAIPDARTCRRTPTLVEIDTTEDKL
jgi:hypothetical protein